MFIDNIVLTTITMKSTKKDDIGYYNTIIRRLFKPLFNDGEQIKIMCISEDNDKVFLTESNINKYKKS